MAAEVICDGCGKRAAMEYCNRAFVKPEKWYQHIIAETGAEEGRILVACSRSCIERIAEETGETAVVWPF